MELKSFPVFPADFGKGLDKHYARHVIGQWDLNYLSHQ